MKKILCKMFGHFLLPQKYCFYDFEDGKTAWVQICKCCHKSIYCIKGYVKTEPDYICKTIVDTPINEVIKYPFKP